MTDMEILKKAYALEYRDNSGRSFGGWQSYQVGASRSDIMRLKDSQLIYTSTQQHAGKESFNIYRLTSKGVNLVKGADEEEDIRVTAEEVKAKMDLVIGFDDIKEAMADAVEKRNRLNILMKGPPACAKSVLLECVRDAVPRSYLAFGIQTSAAGLSDVLFEQKPRLLLLDEVDKMTNETRAVILGLMQNGEIIETKSKKTRGIILNTQVFAACNDWDAFKPEFMSRFGFKPTLPNYTRDEFIRVCIGYLGRAEQCPPNIAQLIGEMIFDNKMGDVRQGRGVWQMMKEPTEAEVQRIIQLKIKYGDSMEAHHSKLKRQRALI